MTIPFWSAGKNEMVSAKRKSRRRKKAPVLMACL